MRIALFVVLMLVPANAGCAALPMDDELRSRTGQSPVGSLLKKVAKQEERAPAIKAIAEGESCRCEAVCQ